MAALLVAATVVAGPRLTRSPSGPTPAPAAGLRPETVAPSTFGRLPLRFEANRGQSDPSVDIIVRGQGYTAFLTPTGTVLARPGAEPVTMRVEGARPSAVTGQRPLPGVSNYFRGNDTHRWVAGVPSYAGARQAAVLPGVDLSWHAQEDRLKYDLTLAPGTDPAGVVLAFDGSRDMRVDTNGDLVVSTAGGDLRQDRPVVYQLVDGRRVRVSARYDLRGDGRVGFAFGAYDPARALVVDPALSSSSTIGGSLNDSAFAVAVDATGASYVADSTTSPDFPVLGSIQPAVAGTDAFVAKLNPAGTAFVYATYLGGAINDTARGLAVDASGAAYVTGQTSSTNFPTAGPVQAANGGGPNDAFVTKLNPAGSALVYSTYLGAAGDDIGRSLAVDGAGAAYVGGRASAGFPTATPLQAASGGGFDAFVAKLNPAGSALAYSTYLGGSLADEAFAVAVDGANSAYVAGTTSSTNLPTASPIQAANAGGADAFVAKLNPAGSALAYSTYLGGDGTESGSGLAVAGDGSAVVVGDTASDNFRTAAPFQAARAGEGDAFVTRISPAGTGLASSTFLGGSSSDNANAVALGPDGSIHVAGSTGSSNFPVKDPVAPRAGNGDAFVAQLD
ncbi:MAG: SBBP repeat-containing protein, partial [Acidimicrobiales bacterium]